VEDSPGNQAEATPVDVALDNDLPDFFIRRGRRRRGIRPAWEMVRDHRMALIGKSSTGRRPPQRGPRLGGQHRAAAERSSSLWTSAASRGLLELTRIRPPWR